MEFEILENENLQSIREFYTLYIIKHKYPKNILTKVLSEHQKKFINFITCVEYYSEFLYGNTATEILLIDTPYENIRNKIKDIEATGYKFIKHRKIIISTFNSIRDLNPLFYIKKIPKQMVEYTLLKLIDTNPELFRNISQNYYTPIASYIDMKLYDYKDYPLNGLREIKYT